MTSLVYYFRFHYLLRLPMGKI
uniref:Uncharacterized protein n=1 Tax=Rhizophora mucronata TaxID=61149 RepID=A0A2P2JC14_RHIMU